MNQPDLRDVVYYGTTVTKESIKEQSINLLKDLDEGHITPLQLAAQLKFVEDIITNVKEELHGKLEEFQSTTDNLEEIHENREQIEISKHYERMPSATLMATSEFNDDKIYSRNPTKEAVKKEFQIED